jgi:hypothetical protein
VGLGQSGQKTNKPRTCAISQNVFLVSKRITISFQQKYSDNRRKHFLGIVFSFPFVIKSKKAQKQVFLLQKCQ